MVDKIETITLLAHPFDRDNNELVDKDSRIEAQVAGKDVWKVWTTVPWSDFPNNNLTMPRTSSEKPLIGAYQVEFNRGNVKRGKDGSSNDYDYFWNAISWKLLDEQPAQPSQNGGQPSGPRSYGGSSAAEEKKDRSVALSYAKDAWCAGKIERDEVFELAVNFHDAMVNGFTEEE